MNKLYVFCAFCAATLWSLSNVSAQPALERLEKEVQRQLEEGGKPSGPAAGGQALAPGAGGQAFLPAAKPPQAKALAPGGQAFLPAPAQAPPERGYLGALLDDTADRGRGVRIMRVTPGSPAEKAGLKKGDLITALSGIRVRQMTEVADVLEQIPPETEVTFFVRRGQTDQLISVTLGHRPPATRAAASPPQRPIPPAPKAPQPAPPVADTGAPVSIDALLQRVEALERDVQTLKEQNRRLEERIGAIQRPVTPPLTPPVAPPIAPKPPTP